MEYYDIAAHTCLVDPLLEKRLGFKRILLSGTDLQIEHVDQKVGRFGVQIAYGANKKALFEHSRNGTRALAISDFEIDFKLLESMADNKTILCISLDNIVGLRDAALTRAIYRASKLVHRAKKYRLEISIASMAQTQNYLCSYMQLIELGKLLGLEEQYARHSLSDVNKQLWD